MPSQLDRFNWLAKYYDQLATIVFGKTLHKGQVTYLCEIPKGATILILGGGTGKVMQELLRINSVYQIWYVEASSTMIELAKRNITNESPQQIYFIHGTEDSIPVGIKFNAVITHFFLDLFSEPSLKVLVEKIYPSLAPDGVWLACDFISNGKWWQKSTLRVMYLFFKLTCGIESRKLPPWEYQLRLGGLSLIKCRFFLDHFIKTTLFKKNH